MFSAIRDTPFTVPQYSETSIGVLGRQEERLGGVARELTAVTGELRLATGDLRAI
jgi:hypothetical protein